VRCGVTAVSVHAAARSLSPVTADSVAKLGTTASIDGGNTCWLGAYHARGLTKNRLTGAGDRGRPGDGGGRSSRVGGSSIFAAILASVGDKTVTISRSTVSVRRAATAVSTVGVACCTPKVFAATAVAPRGGRVGRSRSYWLCTAWLCTIVATREAAITAVGRSSSAPSVLAAARAGVSSALGVAKQVAVGRTAFAIERVLGSLPLFRETNGRAGPGNDLGVVALGVGGTGVAFCAVLACQALGHLE
jgi:hypothetical protein